MSISRAFGDVVAVLALVLSVVATIATIRFNNRQKSLVESQRLLNLRLLAREELDAETNRRADLSANFVKMGKSSWRLKVFNRGKAVASNVSITWPDDDDFLIRREVEAKFPLEVLEPMQGVELLALVSFGSRSKHQITLRWSDEYSESNEKTVYPTL